MSYLTSLILGYGPEKLRGMPSPVPPGHVQLRNKKTGEITVCRVWPGEAYPYDRDKWEEIPNDSQTR